MGLAAAFFVARRVVEVVGFFGGIKILALTE